ncbi:MAG: NAD(P)H-hydrate dehydratase [Epsilonproteobacteria bacterium]|nr:NAD(P)H-hydrate dehydratase [Campylobacterota bacterium]
MKIYLPKDVRIMDSDTVKLGIDQQILMENAGSATARIIADHYPKCRIFVACGSGHNGGDGLVASRYLANYGYKVDALIIDPTKMDELTNKELMLADACGVNITDKENYSEYVDSSDIIVDAIFGTGLSRIVSGFYAKIIEELNRTGKPIVSCDIPSGINGISGALNGIAIKAAITVTYQVAKAGIFNSPGFKYAGKIFVEDIGIPNVIVAKAESDIEFVEQNNLPQIPARELDSHKGDFGHLLIIGGSRGKSGAVIMAANAALRVGTGLVSCAIPQSLSNPFGSAAISAMSLPLPEENGSISFDAIRRLPLLLDRKTAIAVGPGLSVTMATRALLRSVLLAPITKIIDADGLNSTDINQLKKHNGGLIITPHPGEFARLINKPVAEIQNNRIDYAKKLSCDINATVILKGARTVIANEKHVWINSTGGPALAKGGSGDYLTGIVAGLSAQGMPPEQASILGTWIHGKASDLAEEEFGTESCLPTDLDKFIGRSILSVKSC